MKEIKNLSLLCVSSKKGMKFKMAIDLHIHSNYSDGTDNLIENKALEIHTRIRME